MIELPKPLKGCNEDKHTRSSFPSNEEANTGGDKGKEKKVGRQEVTVPATVIEEVQNEESDEDTTEKPCVRGHSLTQVPETNCSKEEDAPKGEEGETEEESRVCAQYLEHLRAAIGNGVLVEFFKETRIGDAKKRAEEQKGTKPHEDADGEETEIVPLPCHCEDYPNHSEGQKSNPVW